MDDAKTDEPGTLLVAPRSPHPHGNWLEFIGAGVAGGFASGLGADVYGDVKVACRAAVKKFRDRPSDPDEESEWVHQLVAEAFIGPCPPRHKLVHLNGTCSDNRLVNLAYVPESDPRPAAPLKVPEAASIHITKAVAGKAAKSPAGGKKRRQGKRKHH